MKKNVAILGCGNISEIYLKNLTEVFRNVDVYAVCDLDSEKAKERAEQFNVPRIMTLEEMLADENVDIVLNLTTPLAHYPLCKKIIEAKKNVYVEKPISITYAEGLELVELAKKNGVLFGCAPDTFMGAGLQTCRKIIDDGTIGDIVGATAFMVGKGPEDWHPNPDFFYKKGAGPLFDMGSYYLTALVSMFGRVESVMAMNTKGREQRKITSEPNYGKMIDVEVPTHVNSLLRFENGTIGNMIMSFDVYGSSLPRIEIYGTKGSMIVPDPNTFGGEILIKQDFDEDFHSYPLMSRFSQNSRGLGVSDMAQCLIDGKKDICASSDMALHVLEIMETIENSGEAKKEIELKSSCERPRKVEL